MELPILTARLRLRAIDEARDFGPLLSFVGDRESMRYMLWFVEGEAQLREWFARVARDAAGPDRREHHFAVEVAATGALAGFCCIELPGDNPGAEPGSLAAGEIGYWLLPGARGQGYATEVAGALLEACFAPTGRGLGLHRAYAKCDELNVASARVLRKVGMALEGREREHVWLRDHWRSSLHFGMLAAEYAERRGTRAER